VDLDHREYRILITIQRYGQPDGRVRAKDLFNRLHELGMSKQTLVNKLRRLVHKGYLENEVNASTRPIASFYKLTRKAVELLIGRWTLSETEFVKEQLVIALNKNGNLQERLEALQKVLRYYLTSICFFSLQSLHSAIRTLSLKRSEEQEGRSVLMEVKETTKSGALIERAYIEAISFELEIIREHLIDLVKSLSGAEDLINMTFEDFPDLEVQVTLKRPT